jgi:hypothetical protein
MAIELLQVLSVIAALPTALLFDQHLRIPVVGPEPVLEAQGH